MDKEISNKTQGNCWTKSEAAEIVKALAVIVNNHNAYGNKASLKDIFAFYEYKLQNRFSGKQVVHALDIYTDRDDGIPKPSHIINILDPAPKEITGAEFVEAQKWQERNGFPMFSDAKDTIEAYKAQESAKRKPDERSDAIRLISERAVKKIN